jgi:sugar phosphate isomerase/epimerase
MFPVRFGERGVTFHANQDLEEIEGIPNIVFDTSHAAVAGHDVVETRRRLGDRIRHVHLSDNAGRGWDSHLPPGEGVLDLDGFLEDLATDGYGGTISLEVDLRRYLTDDARLRAVMIEMRERCEKRLVAGAPEI